MANGMRLLCRCGGIAPGERNDSGVETASLLLHTRIMPEQRVQAGKAESGRLLARLCMLLRRRLFATGGAKQVKAQGRWGGGKAANPQGGKAQRRQQTRG